MNNQLGTPPGRAISAADLTFDVCLQIAQMGILDVDVSIRALIALTTNKHHRHKRPGGAIRGLRAASVGSPPHNIRVPMHLTRVPRG